MSCGPHSKLELSKRRPFSNKNYLSDWTPTILGSYFFCSNRGQILNNGDIVLLRLFELTFLKHLSSVLDVMAKHPCRRDYRLPFSQDIRWWMKLVIRVYFVCHISLFELMAYTILLKMPLIQYIISNKLLRQIFFIH